MPLSEVLALLADRDQWKERAEAVAQHQDDFLREKLHETQGRAAGYAADADRLAAELKAACDDRDSYVRTLETVSASEDRLAAECERLREALTRIAGDGSTATIPQGIAREALSTQPAYQEGEGK